MAVHVSGLFTKGCRLGVVGLHCLTLTFPTTRKTAEVTPISGQRAWNVSLQNAISAPASLSFKDIVEKMAEDNGILFMPVPGQKRGVTFAMKGSQWTPVSLSELMRLA